MSTIWLSIIKAVIVDTVGMSFGKQSYYRTAAQRQTAPRVMESGKLCSGAHMGSTRTEGQEKGRRARHENRAHKSSFTRNPDNVALIIQTDRYLCTQDSVMNTCKCSASTIIV